MLDEYYWPKKGFYTIVSRFNIPDQRLVPCFVHFVRPGRRPPPSFHFTFSLSFLFSKRTDSAIYLRRRQAPTSRVTDHKATCRASETVRNHVLERSFTRVFCPTNTTTTTATYRSHGDTFGRTRLDHGRRQSPPRQPPLSKPPSRRQGTDVCVYSASVYLVCVQMWSGGHGRWGIRRSNYFRVLSCGTKKAGIIIVYACLFSVRPESP